MRRGEAQVERAIDLNLRNPIYETPYVFCYPGEFTLRVRRDTTIPSTFYDQRYRE